MNNISSYPPLTDSQPLWYSSIKIIHSSGLEFSLHSPIARESQSTWSSAAKILLPTPDQFKISRETSLSTPDHCYRFYSCKYSIFLQVSFCVYNTPYKIIVEVTIFKLQPFRSDYNGLPQAPS